MDLVRAWRGALARVRGSRETNRLQSPGVSGWGSRKAYRGISGSRLRGPHVTLDDLNVSLIAFPS
jgi:hypothetical protein